MHAQEIISGISALGTLSAVLVALFKGVPRKPKIDIQYEIGNTPYCTKSKIKTDRLYDAYYFRLRIKNKTNRNLFKVHVYLNDLKIRNLENNEYEIVKDFVPMNFIWTNSTKGTEQSIYSPHFSPDMELLIDIGRIVEPSYRQNNEDLRKINNAETYYFELEVEAPTWQNSHLLGTGNYIIDLLIGAENSKPINKKIELNFSRNWESINELINDRNFIKLI